MHAEHDDRAARRDEVDRAGEALLRARGLDDDVVGAVGPDPGAEPLAGLPLVRMARLERDVVGAHPAGAGDREQAERARADDRDTLSGPVPAEAQGVPRDRCRLDDRRVTKVEARRERRRGAPAAPELLGHAAVGGHAERPLRGGSGRGCTAPRQHCSHSMQPYSASTTTAVPSARDAGELVAEDPAVPNRMYIRSDAQTLVDRMSSSSPEPAARRGRRCRKGIIGSRGRGVVKNGRNEDL